MKNETKEQEFLKDYIILCQKHGYWIGGNYLKKEDVIREVDTFFYEQMEAFENKLKIDLKNRVDIKDLKADPQPDKHKIF